MIPGYADFKNLSKAKQIKMQNEKFDKTIQKFDIFQIPSLDITNQQIFESIRESEVIIIDKYVNNEIEYVICCIKSLIMIINPSEESLIKDIYSTNKVHKVPKISSDPFYQEFNSFKRAFKIINTKEDTDKFWSIICPSIAAYLIEQSYSKTYEDRINEFFDNMYLTNQINNFQYSSNFKQNEFIELKLIGQTFSSKVSLCYHIENEKLYAIKTFNKEEKLKEREMNNYKKIKYFFIPKYYGKISDCPNSFVIEYINGQTFNNINKDELNFDQKVKIIIELLYTFQYLHNKNFVYRDLKPNNLILDKNYHIVLIDFDRMINIKEKIENEEQEFTKYFDSDFVDPKINEEGNKPSFQNDIYSIGKFISFFFNENSDNIKEVVKNCLKDNLNERMSLSEIIINFENLVSLMNTIDKIMKYQNDTDAQTILGNIYEKGEYIKQDINKAIYYYSLAANQNNTIAQNYLGNIYYEGEYIKRDINKAIYYYSLAANQNDAVALNKLGYFYYNGEYIKRDINKAIYYYSLAANQNDAVVQYNLGYIYYNGEYIKRDINKAIYYYSLAANQNDAVAQTILGTIYHSGKYIKRDINKSIHYYSLAANQNDPVAQNNLGYIYYNGEYIKRDINKAIYYYSLAANQNDVFAQTILGTIYYNGEYIKRDINKSIYYYSLAANKNFAVAQTILGTIYHNGKYIKRDYNKSIHYYSLAANQNHASAQANLGNIYEKGEYIKRDFSKAIYYYSLAANQNDVFAQTILGNIYEKGEYIKRDINKAIYYYSLAANQNDVFALNKLGYIYYNGEYIKRDINKAIYYYSLAANQNDAVAQYNLGYIYYNGEYIKRDINKAIYYYSLAANQNHANSQFELGRIYLNGIFVPKTINKAVYYLYISAEQRNNDARFLLGVVYSEGKVVKRNIEESIHYYKEASSINHSKAKNNLAMIYKNGFYTKQNLWYAIELLKEAVKLNDKLSIYNLSHLYFYENGIESDIETIIELLLKSHIIQSYELLCIVLVKKYQIITKEIIVKEINSHEFLKKIEKEVISQYIYLYIKKNSLKCKINYENHYNKFKNNDFMYDTNFKPIRSYLLMKDHEKEKEMKNKQLKNINDIFYEGFGISLLT